MFVDNDMFEPVPVVPIPVEIVSQQANLTAKTVQVAPVQVLYECSFEFNSILLVCPCLIV